MNSSTVPVGGAIAVDRYSSGPAKLLTPVLQAAAGAWLLSWRISTA